MPHVQQNKSVKRNGQFSKADLNKTMRPAFARDNLNEAFAGSENNGAAGTMKSQKHSPNVKSRQSKQSKMKTPVR